MSNLFTHTVQPLGSTTSPVEDLAAEVAEAFDKISDTYDIEPNMLTTFREAIGNFSLEDLQPHGVSKSFSEVHNITSKESSFLLKAVPEGGSLSISYVDNLGTTKILREVGVNTPFTGLDEFKVNGKQVKVNLDVPRGSSISLGVVYKGETFKLGGKKFLPNVFKKLDGTFKVKAVESGSEYELEYDRNINDFIDEFKISPGSEITFFSTEDGNEWTKIEVDSHSLGGNKVKFSSTSFNNTPTTYVTAYVNNTSLSGVINSLYKEFIEHKHGNEELTQNIDSYSLTNRVVSNDKIIYKDDNIVNYQYPQYFNREGHNPNLDAVFENSILGDVFISRQLTDGSGRYKGLDKDSNSIIFGDPSLGPKLRYSRENRSTLLSNIDNINGLKITTLDPSKWVLSLNNSQFYSTDTSGLKIKPENNLVDITSEDASIPNTVKVDAIEVGKLATIKDAKISSLKINDIHFKEHDNNVDLEVVPLPNSSGIAPQIFIRMPLTAKRFTAEEFNVDSGKFKQLAIGDVVFNEDLDKNLVITTNTDREINVNPKTNFKEGSFQNLELDNVSFGSIIFDKDTISGEDVLSIHSTASTSTIDVKAKTILRDVDIKSSTQDNLKIGDVLLSETDNKSLEFSSENNKPVIFSTPVEFKNITTNPGGTVNLNELVVGNTKVSANGNNTEVNTIDTSIDTTFKINSKSYLKETEIELGVIKSGKADTLKIGGSSFVGTPDGNIVVEPDNPTDNTITVRTKTLLSKGEADNFLARALNYNSSLVGKVTLAKDLQDNLEVTSEDEAKVIFKAPVVLDNAVANNLVMEGGTLKGTTVSGLKVGNIVFQKEDTSDSLEVIREDDVSKYLIKVPVNVTDLTANILDAESLKPVTIDFDGVKTTIDQDNNLVFSDKDKDDPKKVIFKSEVEMDKLSLKTFSTPLYRLYNKDKIELDADNYIQNINNRLVIVNSKAVNYVGSDKNSGIQFSHEQLGNYSAKQYISSNAGAKAVETERNFFFETDTTNGVYFIKNTSNKISVNGTQYGFNDATAQRNISDLTRWFRSDIYVGKIEGYSANLKTADESSKNGLVIGSTRLSVIGPGTDCPEGITVLESGDSIHLVQPMGDKETGCKNLSYQEVFTGPLNVKGAVSIDGGMTLTEDFITNGTLAGQNLVVANETELRDLVVTGGLKVSDKATFNSEVEFKNPLTFKNEVVSESNITARSFISTNNSEFQKSVEVTKDLNVGGDVAVQGSLTTKSGFRTDAKVIARGVETQALVASDTTINGGLVLNREMVLSGSAHFKNVLKVEGDIETNSKLSVRDGITTGSIHAIKEVYSRGKLTALDGAEIQGRTIQIGGADSAVTIDGKLQFNTSDVAFNSAVSIYENFKVAGNSEFNGKIEVKNGLDVEGSIKVTGNLTVDSNVKFASELKGKSLELDQTLAVKGSITGNSVTAQSIAIENNANIAHLFISGSLTTNTNTRLNAGESHLSSVTTTDTRSENSFAGKIVAAGGISSLRPIEVSESISVGNGNVLINNSGIKLVGDLTARSVKSDLLEGTASIQTPAAIAGSGNRIASSIATGIPARKFVRMNNFAVDGIAVFNSPVVVDTLLFRDLVYLDDNRDSDKAKGLNITARKAYYA